MRGIRSSSSSKHSKPKKKQQTPKTRHQHQQKQRQSKAPTAWSNKIKELAVALTKMSRKKSKRHNRRSFHCSVIRRMRIIKIGNCPSLEYQTQEHQARPPPRGTTQLETPGQALAPRQVWAPVRSQHLVSELIRRLSRIFSRLILSSIFKRTQKTEQKNKTQW